MFGLFKKNSEERVRGTAELRIMISMSVVLSVILIVFSVLCIHTFTTVASAGTAVAEDAFRTAKTQKADELYQAYYRKSYDEAFEMYRVRNDVQINITEVRETAKLEVLEISVTEYSIMEKDDNEHKITSWLEVPVSGIYTVDLLAGEYLVDQERRSVTIRLPRPMLEHVDIDDENVKSRLFENDWINESQGVGADLYQKQRQEAYEKARAEMLSCAEYYAHAESSAAALITNLVKEINSEVKGLVVEVEFMD